jgi:hypothetical protein
MKLSSRLISIVFARFGQRPQLLQASLNRWLPQQAPVLVPIPIRADRRTADQVGRHASRQADWRR